MRERSSGGCGAPAGGVLGGGAGWHELPEPYRRHLIGFVDGLEATMYEIQRLAEDGHRCLDLDGSGGRDVPPPVSQVLLQRLAGLRALTADLRESLGLTPRQRSGLYYLRAVVDIAIQDAEGSLPSNNQLANEVDPTQSGNLEDTLREIRDLLAGMSTLLRQ